MSAERDIYNNLKEVNSIAVAASGTGTVNGTGVDTQGFSAANVAVIMGAAGVGTLTLQESDDNVSFTDVDADETLGTQGVALVQDGLVKLGYVGSKRYIRPQLSMTTGDDLGAFVTLGEPHIAAVEQ